ncbi:MAG: DUF885 family protein, partial [Clostridia bacterium]|nr:DUF885 family protein [Clostridia bacterium]
TDDGYSFHQKLAHPEVYGLESANVPMRWGEFTEADTEAYALECAAWLERLLAIPRAELNARDQFSYDVLQQYLEDASAENVYAYYYEPLTEYNGMHSSIPLALGLFQIESEQDALDYLALLEDVPRYMGQILAYEQERAARGLFMPETALDKVLAACGEIIDASDGFYLIGTFNEAVDGLSGLPETTAAAYKARNQELVAGPFMEAYRALRQGLEALRGDCREPAGLSSLGETAAAYFEYALQLEGNNRLSVEETLELIRNEMYYMLAQYLEVYGADPEALQDTTLTSGDTQTDIDFLKTLTSRLLFELPEHSLRISAFPEELESMVSGAAYVIPPVDDWTDNEILINPAYEDAQRLLTLAHEGYPGHLFQYVYQRSLTDTGLMQRALHFGGYAEGWSQTAEYLVAMNQDVYNASYSAIHFYNHMILNVLLPAIVSIYVNYYGYTEDGIRSYLASLNLDSDELVDFYYALAIEQPLYVFSYASGYCQLAALMRDAEENMGERFDRSAFLKAYLDLGPGYFNLVQERMDVWIDENAPE